MRAGSFSRLCWTNEMDLRFPTEFSVLSYRTSDASIGGSNVVFTHYLLTPSTSGKFEESVINTARGNLYPNDCVFEAGGDSAIQGESRGGNHCSSSPREKLPLDPIIIIVA